MKSLSLYNSMCYLSCDYKNVLLPIIVAKWGTWTFFELTGRRLVYIHCDTILWWLIRYTLRVALSVATTQPIMLSPFVLLLAKHAKWRVVALWSCCPASSEARQKVHCHAACCCNVALSLGL
jgi:hypothetical protein